MRLRLLVLPCLYLALAFSGLAQADMSATQSATNWFKTHDRNGDGYLTPDEVIPYELKVMKRMDANGDGMLSIDEYLAGVPADQADLLDHYRRRFKAMDANGDGFVTPDELSAFYTFLLHTSDSNEDGQVSLEEWLSVTDTGE